MKKENKLGTFLSINSKLEITRILKFEIIFENETIVKELKQNDIYTITFLRDGLLKEVKGKLIEMQTYADCSLGYIVIDYSDQYDAKKESINIIDIRNIKDINDETKPELPEPDTEEKPDENKPSSEI